MIFRHEYRGGVWIDIEHPSAAEIRQVAHEFGIGKRFEAELLLPSHSSLVAADADATLLVLHFPTPGENEGETGSQEIDFVIGERFIVTVRYEVVAPLHNLKRLFEEQRMVGEHDGIMTDVFLEILFAHLYTSVQDHVKHVAGMLASVEKEMFNGSEKKTVRNISNVSREFLHIEASLANQEEPLTPFLKSLTERDIFDDSFSERAGRILEERSRIERLAKTHRAIASELRETNLGLLEVKQNQIIKTLTVVTFILLPLELIALIFHFEVPGTPLIHRPDAFWVIISIMATVAACMILFVYKKRWI